MLSLHPSIEQGSRHHSYPTSSSSLTFSQCVFMETKLCGAWQQLGACGHRGSVLRIGRPRKRSRPLSSEGCASSFARLRRCRRMCLFLYFSICSHAKLRPRNILLALSKAEIPIRTDVTAALPDRAYLDRLAGALNQDPAHPSLAVFLPLVPSPSSFDAAEAIELPTDRTGLSDYARGVSAWLHAGFEDRHMLRTHTWVLRHFIILGVLAEEFTFMPALQSPVFSDNVDRDVLLGIMVKVQQLAAYLLSVPSDVRWHADVTSLAAGGKATGTLDVVGGFVAELVRDAQAEDTYRDSRVVFDVLLYILGDTSAAEADLWMGLARKLEKHGENRSLEFVIQQS
jgi:hypothetical protein